MITKNDLKSGFIPKKSMIKVNKIFNLKQTLAIKKVATVKKSITKNVKQELLKLV